MTISKEFKDKWVNKMTNGSYKKRRYGLSNGGDERCVMAVARETAVELHILPDCDMQGRDLLTEEELRAIGLNQETQYYLSTMNDTYGMALSMDKFPMRLINAVEKLPVMIENKQPLLTYEK